MPSVQLWSLSISEEGTDPCVCGMSSVKKERRNTMIGAVVLLIMVWGSLINYVDLHRHLVSPRERRLTLTLCLTKQ